MSQSKLSGMRRVDQNNVFKVEEEAREVKEEEGEEGDTSRWYSLVADSNLHFSLTHNYHAIPANTTVTVLDI